MKKVSLEEYVDYGVNALKQRKSVLVDTAKNTTNALDRLIIRERIDELDICLNYFLKYEEVPEVAEPDAKK